MMIEIFKYMDRIVDMIRPRQLLYLAIGNKRDRILEIKICGLTDG